MVVAGALVATHLLSAAASMRIAPCAPAKCRSPELSGKSANDASTIAGDLGLSLRVGDARRPTPKIPVGRTVAQVNRRLKPDRPPPAQPAGLKLSAGERAMIMPPPVGETERAARRCGSRRTACRWRP